MKNRILIGIVAFMCGIFVACETTSYAQQDAPLKIWLQNENGSVSTYNIVDSDTGVNYVVVSRYTTECGDFEVSISICPRYNADGTLYTSKSNQQK